MVKRLLARARAIGGWTKDQAFILIELAGVGAVAGGIGWIYGPAGLIAAGGFAIFSIERLGGRLEHREWAEQQIEKLRRRQTAA